MLFIGQSPSATLPYPTAAKATGWIASYPISGSALTNPLHLSRSTIRTRSNRRKPPTPTYCNGPWPPGMSFKLYQLQIQSWLAKWWKLELSDTDKADWASAQAAALASPYPPTPWRQTSYVKSGWPLYCLLNKVSALFTQYTLETVDPTLTPPWPTAPPQWDPPNPAAPATLQYINDTVAYWTLLTPSTLDCNLTVYATKPGKLASLTHPPSYLQIAKGSASFPPADPGTPTTLAFPIGYSFTVPLPNGAPMSAAVRLINPNDGCCTNLLPSPPQNVYTSY